MRNSWTSKWLLLVCLVPWTWAQEQKPTTPPEAKPNETAPTTPEAKPSKASPAEEKPSETKPAEAKPKKDRPAHPDLDDPEIERMRGEVAQLIHSLRTFQPKQTLALIEKSNLPPKFRTFFKGWTYHQIGDYAQASELLHQVKPKDLYGDPFFVERLEEFRRTADALKKFKVLETANFSIRYQDGRDKVLILFLPQILEQVYTQYSSLFAYKRDEKIIVEIMPDYQLFADASALTRDQIETTGTIALCVENRLVALTPRRVAQGYYWPDVIAHEFVHYILTKQGKDQVPLWMQEGTAKFFEARWDAANTAPALDPNMESVLAEAVAANKLLGVDQMMPSFAALPTAALAMQAYAQTTTMIQYLCSQKGEATLRQIILGLAETDGDMNQVLTRFLGKDFAAFEADWKVWLKQQPYKVHPGHQAAGVKLLEEDMPEEKVSELSEQDQRELKHLRLGDLLLERNRYGAALKQFQKITPIEGRLDRQVVLRLATCLQQLNLPKEQITLLDTYLPQLNGDPTMLLFKARALQELNRASEAKAMLIQALRNNPFHPGIHQVMVSLEGENTEAAKPYREALQLLTQAAPAPAPKEEPRVR